MSKMSEGMEHKAVTPEEDSALQGPLVTAAPAVEEPLPKARRRPHAATPTIRVTVSHYLTWRGQSYSPGDHLDLEPADASALRASGQVTTD
jgi:hypothetical protein